MFNSGRDEDAELTGCGFGACFCADISLLTVAAARSFAGKVERFNVHHLHYLPFRDVNEPKLFFLVRFRTPRFLFHRRVRNRTRGHFRGRALLQQQTQQPGSRGPRAASVEHVMCEWSVVTAFTRFSFYLTFLFYYPAVMEIIRIIRSYYVWIKLITFNFLVIH